MTPRRPSDYDEDDVRVRPNPRGSRPRSKDRPRHEDAVPGFVVGVDRGRYTVTVGSGRSVHDVTAMKARELGRKGVVVGDRVGLVGATGGGPDDLARVVRVEPRASVLRRTADDTDDVERIIVANADQLVVVTSLDNPPPRPRLIDRALVAAYDAGLDPLLALTKADLTEPVGVPGQLRPARRAVRRDPPARTDAIEGLEELRERLQGRVSVLLGHSGVGKSTLVNALVPGALRATGVVNDVTGRGRHTSTSAVALRLPGRLGLGRGHTGHPVVRPGPRRPGPDHQPLPGPRAGHRAVPARLHARRAGLCARRVGRLGPGRPGRALPARLAPSAAARPDRLGRRLTPLLTALSSTAVPTAPVWTRLTSGSAPDQAASAPVWPIRTTQTSTSSAATAVTTVAPVEAEPPRSLNSATSSAVTARPMTNQISCLPSCSCRAMSGFPVAPISFLNARPLCSVTKTRATTSEVAAERPPGVPHAQRRAHGHEHRQQGHQRDEHDRRVHDECVQRQALEGGEHDAPRELGSAPGSRKVRRGGGSAFSGPSKCRVREQWRDSVRT